MFLGLPQYILDESDTKGYCSPLGVWPCSRLPMRCIAAARILRIVRSTQLGKYQAAPVSRCRGTCSHSTWENSSDMGRAHRARAFINAIKLCFTCFLSLRMVYDIGGLKLAKVRTKACKFGARGCSQCLQNVAKKAWGARKLANISKGIGAIMGSSPPSLLASS